MLQGLKLFSQMSDILPSESKSSIYCCQMNEQEVQHVVDMSGFSRSYLPFKYLGVPIFSKRLSVAECESLIEKMVLRIKVWNSKNLSYAGWVTSVNSKLLTIHSYWANYDTT